MKNQIESIKSRLLNLSKTHNKSHQLTLTRYFQERLLFRISISDYKNHFFLKGGVLIYALEREASRPTLDLDLLAKNLVADQNRVSEIFSKICGVEYRKDGVSFDLDSIIVSEIIKEGNYKGIRVKVGVSLGNIQQRLQIDLGFGDIIVPEPVKLIYPTLIDMVHPEIWAYSVESLIAEKFEAMIDLAELNSRMKDFYDIYRIILKNNYRQQELEAAIDATIRQRRTPLDHNHVIFTESFYKSQKRIKQWTNFLKNVKLDQELTFEETMKTITQKLYPIYEKLRMKYYE